MAGHSHFKNVMRRKGAQDAKRTKKFTKILREIISSVKGGSPDPGSNPRLRSAIQAARAENIPRDKIEGAIKRASGNVDADNYESVRYEGYGPGGAAVIAEALTDNRNRTASEIRAAFTKFGGNLGETGSVNFMFDRVGQITYPAKAATEEKMFEAALEAGADNCESSETHHSITCTVESLGSVRDALEKTFGEAESAKITWLPKTTSPVNAEQAEGLMKLIEMLEDNDDVQEVFSNFEMPDEVLAKLSA